MKWRAGVFPTKVPLCHVGRYDAADVSNEGGNKERGDERVENIKAERDEVSINSLNASGLWPPFESNDSLAETQRRVELFANC